MPINSNYLFVASMDVDPAKEALFNEVYDTEHIPNLLKVPGAHAVTRIKGEPFAVSIGGEEQQVAHEGPRYSALYEIDGPHVLVSPEWAQAVELGRWPSQVRPYTRNRRHTPYQVCERAAAIQPGSLSHQANAALTPLGGRVHAAARPGRTPQGPRDPVGFRRRKAAHCDRSGTQPPIIWTA